MIARHTDGGANERLTKSIDEMVTDFFRDKQGGPVSAWRCWFERILMASLAVVLIALQALFLVMVALAVFDIATAAGYRALPDALVTYGMYIMGAAIVPLGAAFVWASSLRCAPHLWGRASV